MKGQDGIERLSRVKHVILDKTGTLTEGKLKLVDAFYAIGVGGEPQSLSLRSASLSNEQQEILRSVAALEKLSGHAISTAFAEFPESKLTVSEFKSKPGLGIEGVINSSHYVIGSEAFLRKHGIEVSDEFIEFAKQSAEKKLTTIFVGKDNRAAAAYALGDPLRGGAGESVNELKAMGLELEILSGDHPEVVASVARQLSISSFSGRVSPEEKLARVEALEQANETTAMIGDGVNDAAALSRSTAGISVAGATEIARDAADVFVSQRGPGAIADLFKLSRRSMKVVRLNIAIAIFYNIIGAGLAMAGLVSPVSCGGFDADFIGGRC